LIGEGKFIKPSTSPCGYRLTSESGDDVSKSWVTKWKKDFCTILAKGEWKQN